MLQREKKNIVKREKGHKLQHVLRGENLHSSLLPMTLMMDNGRLRYIIKQKKRRDNREERWERKSFSLLVTDSLGDVNFQDCFHSICLKFVVEGEVGTIGSDAVKLMMMVSMIEESWPFDLCPFFVLYGKRQAK